MDYWHDGWGFWASLGFSNGRWGTQRAQVFGHVDRTQSLLVQYFPQNEQLSSPSRQAGSKLMTHEVDQCQADFVSETNVIALFIYPRLQLETELEALWNTVLICVTN